MRILNGVKIYYLSLFIGLLFLSCEKEKIQTVAEPSPYWGNIIALQNGRLWIADLFAVKNNIHGNGLEIISNKFNGGNIRKESLDFTKIPFTLGTYPVVNTDARDDDGLVGAGFWHVDHDVIYSSYKILESDSSSFITLTSYDTISQEIRGHFDLTFIKDQANPEFDFPDTIRFRNGVFHTKILEQ